MDLFKNNLFAGIGIAVAASVLAPIVIPAAGRIGRPLTKSLVRGGMALYERGREAMAVAGEAVEDIMAEIRAENASSQAPGTAQTEGAEYAGTSDDANNPVRDQAADRVDRPFGGISAAPDGVLRATSSGAGVP